MTTTPEPLATLTCEEFRRRLAGLVVDDDITTLDADVLAEQRNMAMQIGLLLARHYNRDMLDRMKIWQRLESALRVGVSQAQGDAAAMLSTMLEHVKAEASRVSGDPHFQALLTRLCKLSNHQLEGLRRYIGQTIYAVIVFTRQAWEQETSRRGGPTLLDDLDAGKGGDA